VGSLLEGIDVGSSRAAPAVGNSRKKAKLIFAVGCLGVAAVLIAWNLGVFGKPSESSQPEPTSAGMPDPSPLVQPAANAPRNAPAVGMQPPVRN